MNDESPTMLTVRAIRPRLPGWCSEAKAARLIDTVRKVSRERPVVVEIGVFGGSSLLPLALALAERGRGLVYGIDPWRTDAALESMVGDDNQRWWSSVDLDVILAGLRARIRELHLEPHCRLIRSRSEDVVEFFELESIDVLHVDGNHSEEKCLADIAAYLPRVRMGGSIFFDDVSWLDGGRSTTKHAVEILRDECRELSPVGDCAVFERV